VNIGARPAYDELVRDDRVHDRVYTDPQIFEEEIDRIFHRGWVFVGHEGELPERGDYRTRELGRQPVIFVRGDDGVVRVLMNRCTHRGSAVCPYERGNTRRFTCAYHGWTFRNTGGLAAVPHPEQYGDSLDRDSLGLRPVPRCESYRGFVFASLSAEVVPLASHLGPRVLAEMDIAADLSPTGRLDVTAGVHKFGYGGNWKLQLENSVDGYHISHLHRSYFRIQEERSGSDGMRFASGSSPALVHSLGNGHVAWDMSPVGFGKATIERLRGTPGWPREYYDALVAAHGSTRADEVLSHGAGHVAIFPNLVIIASQLRLIRPIAVGRTEVFIYPTLLGDVPAEVNEQRLRRHESFYGPAGGGATDDLEVFERVTTGLRAKVDPWIRIDRGLGRDEVHQDGTVTGHITSELSNRAILGHWRRVMCGEVPVQVAPGRFTEGRDDA
jgi:phenylpropionate dioxygenase-like ring-hydroxylating dioxygenase large terminal subunit